MKLQLPCSGRQCRIEFRQRPPHFLPRAVQSGFDCAGAQSQMFGQLPIRPILCVFEHQDFSIALRQAGQCPPNHFLPLVGQQPIQRIDFTGVIVGGRTLLAVTFAFFIVIADRPQLTRPRHRRKPSGNSRAIQRPFDVNKYAQSEEGRRDRQS